MKTGKMTLRQAAETVACSTATLSKALKKGDLSHEKRDDGSFSIDPAELSRWNETRSRRGQRSQTKTPKTPLETPENSIENSALRDELNVLRAEKVKMLESQIENLTSERDNWRKQAQQLALADHSQDNTTPPSTSRELVPVEPVQNAPEKRKGWLGRLFG